MNVERLEARNAIRLLCYKWHARSPDRYSTPDLRIFVDWLEANGYSHYLKFESDLSPGQDVRTWFADEFKQA
jgi:hypothetical protein